MRVFLSIVAVLVLIGGLVAGFFADYWVMGMAFFGFVGCLLAANLDRIESSRHREVGLRPRPAKWLPEQRIPFANFSYWRGGKRELSLSLVKRSGRFGGYSDEEQDRIKNDLISVLREIKVSEADIQGVLVEWHRVVIMRCSISYSADQPFRARATLRQ